MKKIWLFIIFALIIQEPATTDAAIFQARNLGINLIIFNLIWLIATILDILIGYKIGTWTQDKFSQTRIIKKTSSWAIKIEDFMGRRGENFALIFLGVINFPYLNAFIASWFKNLSFRKSFILIFIGDVFYWLIAWSINIGVRMFVSDTTTALYIVVGTGLAFAVFSKAILRKILND